MSVYTADIEFTKNRCEQILYMESFCESYTTGRNISNIRSGNNLLLNTSVNHFTCTSDIKIKHHQSNKKYLKYYSDFEKQYKKNSEYLNEVSFEIAKDIMSASLNFILSFNPDKFSLEVTHDYSIFYTFMINDYTIYISHFIEDDSIDDEEITFAVFKNNIKLPSFAGSFESFKSEFSNLIVPKIEPEFY